MPLNSPLNNHLFWDRPIMTLVQWRSVLQSETNIRQTVGRQHSEHLRGNCVTVSLQSRCMGWNWHFYFIYFVFFFFKGCSQHRQVMSALLSSSSSTTGTYLWGCSLRTTNDTEPCNWCVFPVTGHIVLNCTGVKGRDFLFRCFKSWCEFKANTHPVL